MSLIEPQQERGKDCLNCAHHGFDNGVVCNHPARPQEHRVVVRWAKGCPQHQHKENHEHR